MSLRDNIFATDDIERETVEIPEWGGIRVEVRSMDAAERGRIEGLFAAQSNASEPDFSQLYPQIVVATVFDPDTSEQVFEAGDVEALLHKSGAVIGRLGQLGLKMSGITPEAEQAQGKGSSSTSD